jgi:hypothetical protein
LSPFVVVPTRKARATGQADEDLELFPRRHLHAGGRLAPGARVTTRTAPDRKKAIEAVAPRTPSSPAGAEGVDA